jgi:hypothetical protein
MHRRRGFLLISFRTRDTARHSQEPEAHSQQDENVQLGKESLDKKHHLLLSESSKASRDQMRETMLLTPCLPVEDPKAEPWPVKDDSSLATQEQKQEHLLLDNAKESDQEYTVQALASLPTSQYKKEDINSFPDPLSRRCINRLAGSSASKAVTSPTLPELMPMFKDAHNTMTPIIVNPHEGTEIEREDSANKAGGRQASDFMEHGAVLVGYSSGDKTIAEGMPSCSYRVLSSLERNYASGAGLALGALFPFERDSG